MANALKEAPLKKQGQLNFDSKEDEILYKLGIELDPERRYVFQLAVENPDRELPVWNMRTNKAMPIQKYRPRHNIVLTSQIVWDKKRVNLRYYDGCDTIFTSDQPREKDVIDLVIKSTQQREFTYGKFSCYGYEKMLIVYLLACSWNVNSPFRTHTANGIFMLKDEDVYATKREGKLDLIEKAMNYAREASELKMMIHANYLMIPMVDEDSMNELSPKAIRALYREHASLHPEEFIKSYTDKTIEVRYYIDKALETGKIKSNMQPNCASWETGTTICDISGLKTNPAIADKLLEFSQTEEGADFLIQLKALYN